jgi:hypothetical protein
MESLRPHPRSAGWTITAKLDKCIHTVCSRGQYIHQRTDVSYTYQVVFGKIDHRFSLNFFNDRVRLSGNGLLADYTERDNKTFNESECIAYLLTKMMLNVERQQGIN